MKDMPCIECPAGLVCLVGMADSGYYRLSCYMCGRPFVWPMIRPFHREEVLYGPMYGCPSQNLIDKCPMCFECMERLDPRNKVVDTGIVGGT